MTDPAAASAPEGSTPDPARCALALDVGGTKMAAGIVADGGEVVVSAVEPTPPDGTAEELFGALTAAADRACAAIGLSDPAAAQRLRGVGLATAAPLDLRTGTVSPVNIPGWRGFPIRDRLARRYRLPVAMIGDAVAVAAGEAWRGAAVGRRNVLGMVVSTGVGGGLIIDGRVVAGTSGNAGQIGHVSVDPAGPDCVCGGTGCLEAIASGRSIAAWAASRGLADAVDAQAVAAAARAGNPLAQQAFRRAGQAIGQAVAGAVTLLDLDVVVIGGGVAQAGSVLFDPITDGYRRFAALGYASSPRIVPALLGGSAGLIGAAAQVFRPS